MFVPSPVPISPMMVVRGPGFPQSLQIPQAMAGLGEIVNYRRLLVCFGLPINRVRNPHQTSSTCCAFVPFEQPGERLQKPLEPFWRYFSCGFQEIVHVYAGAGLDDDVWQWF